MAVRSVREDASVLARPYRALTIGTVALCALIAYEYLAVATAMPAVAEALDGLALFALAFGGALAAGVVGMVVSGGWSDRRGPAGPLWYGVAWFVVGLLLAGLAPAMWVVVLARVVQGFGAGLLSVALYVVVGHVYPARLRPRIFAAFAAAWVVPSIVGPALTGLVVQHAGWRWVFLAVPVLAVPAALLVRPALAAISPQAPAAAASSVASVTAAAPGGPSSVAVAAPGESSVVAAGSGGSASVAVSPPAAAGSAVGSGAVAAAPGGPSFGTGDAPSSSGARAGRRVLWAVGAAVSAGALHYAGQLRGPTGILLLALAVAGLAGCTPRLLPAGTLRAVRGLPTVIALRGMAAAAFIGAEVFIPLLLARERGYSPALAGLALTGGALTWSAGSWYQGGSRWLPSRTRLLRLGMSAIAAGVAVVALTVAPAVPAVLGIAGWCLAGLGMGVVYPTLSVLTLELSAPEEQGADSSALQVTESLFSAVVLALGGSLFAALLARSTPAAYLSGFAVAAGLALLGAVLAGRTSTG